MKMKMKPETATTLKRKHKALDDQIKQAYNVRLPQNDLVVSQLKKEKLILKDRMDK
jgi:uncharacterized protein YdcH (DUF465 family)